MNPDYLLVHQDLEVRLAMSLDHLYSLDHPELLWVPDPDYLVVLDHHVHLVALVLDYLEIPEVLEDL
jgi:hypothetical protein